MTDKLPEPPVKKETALIGSSISVEGAIEGAEDLTVQGSVKGTISLRQNIVTIGKSGRVEADIHARIIIVDGEVVGNLFGLEKVVVHRTGSIKGNIVCARVSLEDGARFKGSIDTSGAEKGMQTAASLPAEDSTRLIEEEMEEDYSLGTQ